MTQIGKIITATGIGLYIPGRKPFTMARDHHSFDKLVEAVNNNDIEAVLDVIDLATRASQFMEGKITIRDGEVFYGSEEVHGVIVDRILEAMGSGIDASYLVKFLENLMENPSSKSRRDLYTFLEAAKMPITEDGRFIAYKWVRSDGYDVHSGTNLHVEGAVISMPRHKVDDDSQRTCSAGLHVCSPGYSKFGSRLFLVAVNPRDVVAVPYDYQNSKMRTCEYEVLQEVDAEDYGQFNSGFYLNHEEDYNEGEEEEEEYENDDY